jgi:translation initiation factor 1
MLKGNLHLSIMQDVNSMLTYALESEDKVTEKQKIHIRFQKTGPRNLTILEGLDDDLDLKRISRAMKKSFHCDCVVLKNKAGEDILQLQGDHREDIREWLIANEIVTAKDAKEQIVLHGY